jgi:hypothetical protein
MGELNMRSPDIFGALVRRRWLAVVLVTMVSGIFAGVASPAHADSIVSETTLWSKPPGTNVPTGLKPGEPGYDPSCTHVPGITRGGKIWVSTYVSDSLGRYNGMKFMLYTKYRRNVAAAKNDFIYQTGLQPTCAWLNSFDNVPEVSALKATSCGIIANAAKRPNRWCQLAGRADVGQRVPSTVDINTDTCRAPKWNGGNDGPLAWASWHNQHIKLATTDIWEQLGLGWIPGHFNIDTYVEDFDMLAGVQNMDPSTFQPTPGDNRWWGYGRVQTAPASELWVRFFDAVARAKGVDPIANNAYLWINLYPDIPAQSQWLHVHVGDYRDSLFQVICAYSPWVADVVGDTNGPHPIIPLPGYGNCDVGFTFWKPASSGAIGRSLSEFGANYNNGQVPPDLKARAPQVAMIIFEAFKNRDTVNPLLIRNPFSTNPQCAVELNLGVSRGSPRKPDGSLDVDVRDPHFRNLIKNLGSVLG